MTDAQLLNGIKQNDNQAWIYICRNMKHGFTSIIGQTFVFNNFSEDDIEDLFQESCIVLMKKVKEDAVIVSREGALFSYLVQIGKLTACNLVKKRRNLTDEEAVTFYNNIHKEDVDYNISVEERQLAQNEFIDRALDALSKDCKDIFRYFYWDHKSMDDIANIMGMRNADSAKTKKSKCMSKFKEVGKILVKCEDFDEEELRDAVERACLRELIKDEKMLAQGNISMVALNVDENKDTDEK